MPGHKIAREDIAAGRRHHQVRPGHRLRDQARSPPASTSTPRTASSAPTTRTTTSAPTSPPPAPRSRQVAPRTFMGYRRADGQVGTRNYIAALRHGELLGDGDPPRRRHGDGLAASSRDYPNVDGVVAFAHGTGCGMAASGPGFDNLQRVLWGHATHPNVGAAVFVGLGCEVMQVARMKSSLRLLRRRALPRPDHPGHRRHHQDHRPHRRADPRAAARGERASPASPSRPPSSRSRSNAAAPTASPASPPTRRSASPPTSSSASAAPRSSPRPRRSTAPSSCCCAAPSARRSAQKLDRAHPLVGELHRDQRRLDGQQPLARQQGRAG